MGASPANELLDLTTDPVVKSKVIKIKYYDLENLFADVVVEKEQLKRVWFSKASFFLGASLANELLDSTTDPVVKSKVIKINYFDSTGLLSIKCIYLEY